MGLNPRFMIVVAIIVSVANTVLARSGLQSPTGKKGSDSPQKALVLDGRFVHNVGELQMHVSNAGWFGSAPGGPLPFSEQPSAMWPAGSSV